MPMTTFDNVADYIFSNVNVISDATSDRLLQTSITSFNPCSHTHSAVLNDAALPRFSRAAVASILRYRHDINPA